MNQSIEFKKDCIMKTMISEVTDITLTHDYKVLDDIIEGYFDVSGEYKLTKASTQKEEFMFTIPFSIALSSLIDRNSINLTIKDFDYSTEKDILHLHMSLNLDYQEIEIKEEVVEEVITSEVSEEEVIEEVSEEEDVMETVEDIIDSIPEVEVTDVPVFHNELMMDENKYEKIDLEDKKEAEESIKSIISSMTGEESFCKYKVYIMREEDTIESVAIKYNVTLDDLREYNNLENINVGDKIVIPFINVINDEDK